jgi:hypothetical protein
VDARDDHRPEPVTTMVVVAGGSVVLTARSALVTPRAAGVNWIVIGWVCPGARVNPIGPPIRMSAEP